MLREIETQAKALAPILRNYVQKSVDNMQKSLFLGLEQRFLELKTELTSLIPAPVDIDAVAQKAAELLPVPEKGEDGCSVTLDHVQPLVDQAVIRAISGIPMPKSGEKGEKGEDGASVSQDDVQRMIDASVAKSMESIAKPVDGKPGRDAIELDILPRIELKKSYPRGAYARHEGGLWRSYATTDGMKGWECIVAGIASFDIEQIDERNVVAVIKQCDGEEVRRSLSIPAMIYRNVWREGTYFKGDTVTFGGSLWHCNGETTSKPGDGNSDWTLAAKKGRDGK